jgi:tetratricopeptide (TPR) repeat protein
MKYNKYILLALGIMSLASCADIDDQKPEGSTITEEQKAQTLEAVPSRIKAGLVGMYRTMSVPNTYFNSNRADDGGFFSCALSFDLNASDMVCANSGYNWFSVSSEYSDRTANYANPRMRYGLFYNQIKAANDILSSTDSTSTDATVSAYIGQAKACRAFAYLNLAPYFQYRYATSADKPCVPIVTPYTSDFTNNPRATVKQIYDLIVSDLTDACKRLEGYSRDDKSFVNQAVAYGLLARAYLNMGEYAKAAEYAKKAIDTTDAKPATREQVSEPFFYDASEQDWMWGIILSASDVADFGYPTSASQLGSFSGDSYTAIGCYKCINSLLWNKIPSTDIRKQWWVDSNLKSTLLNNQTWTTGSNVFKGQSIASGVIPDVKVAYDPYTNVKFGMKSGIGSATNNNDYPIMRVEEMYLIEAEGLAMSGNLSGGKTILENLIKTYRDPSYTCKATTAEAFQNEVWFQRRVELWGEGFAMSDIMRLGKPVVRIHGTDIGNWPDAFAFNIDANDGWLLMRFALAEINNNKGIVDNTGGSKPQSMQNPNLQDGVTD